MYVLYNYGYTCMHASVYTMKCMHASVYTMYVCMHVCIREGGSPSLFRDDTGVLGFWPFSGV